MLQDAHTGPYATYSGLTDSDPTFADARSRDATAEVTQGSIHAPRELRPSAAPGAPGRATPTATVLNRNAIASNYATAIKQDVLARARRHASTRAASLHASNVPLEVFDNLLATFERNLPTWHRYWRVRASLLGVDSLQPYDLWAPLGSTRPSSRARAVRRLDLRGAGAARRRVRRDRPPRLPRGPLDRRLPEPREDGRRVLGGATRHAAVHRHELRRHRGEPRHARARARPLDALLPRLGDAAADLEPVLPVRRRGRRTSTRCCSERISSRRSPTASSSSRSSTRRWRTSTATSSSCRRLHASSRRRTSASSRGRA